MRQWQALWASVALWAFLCWVYVVSRLLMYPEIAFHEQFIEGIPITFWAMGIVSFLVGFIATVGALWSERV